MPKFGVEQLATNVDTMSKDKARDPGITVEYLASNYRYNEALGRDRKVFVVIKRLDQDKRDVKTNQRRQETRFFGAQFIRGSRNINGGYKDGKVLIVDLANDHLELDTAEWQLDAKQPTGIAVHGSRIVVAEGNRLTVIDNLRQETLFHIESPWFARMHTVEFSPDGKKILTVASSWDTVFEINLETSEIIELRLIDLGYDQTQTGMKLVRRPLTQEERDNGKYLSTSRPQDYKGMGLPTALTPVHLNGVHYDYDDEHLIATAFHQGQAWRINPYTGEITVIMDGLGHPHGFMRDPLYGYILTDTEGEKVYFLDRDFETKQIVSTSGVSPKIPLVMEEFWLQNCDSINNGIYCAIDMPRRSILLFDPVAKEYRRISFNQSWAIQTISDII